MSLAPLEREAFLKTWLPKLETRDARDLRVDETSDSTKGSVAAVSTLDDDAGGVSPVVFADGGELPLSKGNRKRAKPKN